ncbi:MAG: ABC transporter ATP-binding protein [Anaerolineae bacterium]|nr:ABC transporter ATP-binding protein [Anaerolineae bacterium]
MIDTTTEPFAIETRQLTKKFKKTLAVDHLNLQVPRGALFGFIGRNGAGKTTTLRMLAGLLEPTFGEVWVNGERAGDKARKLHHLIGYMPDFFGVYEDMYVWEYLDFYARCYNLTPARRTKLIDELLDLVNLSDKRDANVQALSRGMQQRLCLAHALIHEPQILLLDEPASGLDPRARIEMRELLKELAAMGKTIIVSSHILPELAEMCSHIGIVEGGRLVANGNTAEIRAQLQFARVLRVRILTDQARALELVHGARNAGKPYIVESSASGTTLEMDFHGDDRAAAMLLAEWVARGAPVAEFSESGNALEQVFMQLTTTEL